MISYLLLLLKSLDTLLKADAMMGFVFYWTYVLDLMVCIICIQRFDYNFDAKHGLKASPYD